MPEPKGPMDKEMMLFQIFREAITGEQDAQRTYKEALDNCEPGVVRDVIQQLLDDEVRHEEVLQKYYNELRLKYDTGGRPNA